MSPPHEMMKYYVHDGCTYMIPQYADDHEFHKILLTAERAAREEMKRQGRQHAIYAVKKYDEDGKMDCVDIYYPCIVLEDQEFHKRSDEAHAQYKGCLIYAVHHI